MELLVLVTQGGKIKFLSRADVYFIQIYSSEVENE